ncbi:hypothetical protein ABZ754_15345 [Micromonospora purpureochromogenes]|uniref:hypothetical protein n=1 Tax=Micromonospora purpureochromogenes TaxID=47872 RepID=UPI0033F0C2C9
MDQEHLIRLLLLEFEYLQKAIDKFDALRLAIKGWTVTTVGALIAVGVTTATTLVPLLGLFVVLFFAYMEIVYLDVQLGVKRRSEQIDSYLHDPAIAAGSYQFGMRHAFLGRFRMRNIPSMLATRPEVYNFYLGLSMASGLGSLLVWVIR